MGAALPSQFWVERDGRLSRRISAKNGSTYVRRCPEATLRAIARRIDRSRMEFRSTDVMRECGVPWSAFYVAFSFIKHLGLAVPVKGRRYVFRQSASSVFAGVVVEHAKMADKSVGLELPAVGGGGFDVDVPA